MTDSKLEIVLTAKDLSAKALKSFEGRLKAVSKATFSLKGGLATLTAGYGIKETGLAFLETGIKADKMSRALEAATGSMKEAAEAQEFIKRESDRLGLVFDQQVDAYTKLAAAAEGSNLEGVATKEIYLGIVEASTALQLSQESTSGALRAVEQIMSKGKVQAEELRGQLGERLPGAFRLAADAMGVTTAQLSKMLEQGQVYSEEFLPRFAQALREKYAGSIESASKSAQSNLNRISNTLFKIRNTVMNAGVFDAFNEGLVKINNRMEQWIGQNEDLIAQKVPEYIDGIANSLNRIVGLYNSLPDGVVGAAGAGIVGRMLFGKGAAAPAALTYEFLTTFEDMMKEAQRVAGYEETGLLTAVADSIANRESKGNIYVGKINDTRKMEQEQAPIQSTLPPPPAFKPALSEKELKQMAEQAKKRRQEELNHLDWFKNTYLYEKTDAIQAATDAQVRIEEVALSTQRQLEYENLSSFKHEILEERQAAFTESQNGMVKKLEESSKTMKELSQRTAWAMQENFSNLFFDAITGKLKTLQDYATAVFESIARAFSDLAAQRLVEGLFPSGGLFSSVGGATGVTVSPTAGHPRAIGGPVYPGTSYVVGERGPELLTMGRNSGYVTPNHRIGNGNTPPPVKIEVINQGAPATARQEGSPVFDGKQWVCRMVLEAVQNDEYGMGDLRPGGAY